VGRERGVGSLLHDTSYKVTTVFEMGTLSLSRFSSMSARARIALSTWLSQAVVGAAAAKTVAAAAALPDLYYYEHKWYAGNLRHSLDPELLIGGQVDGYLGARCQSCLKTRPDLSKSLGVSKNQCSIIQDVRNDSSSQCHAYTELNNSSNQTQFRLAFRHTCQIQTQTRVHTQIRSMMQILT
jgi:hypothetical protein